MYTNIGINIPNLVYFKISKFLIWNNSPEDKDIEKLRPKSILTHWGEFFKMISGNLNAVLRIFFFWIIPILVYCYHYWYKVTNIGINIPKSGKSILTDPRTRKLIDWVSPDFVKWIASDQQSSIPTNSHWPLEFTNLL